MNRHINKYINKKQSLHLHFVPWKVRNLCTSGWLKTEPRNWWYVHS